MGKYDLTPCSCGNKAEWVLLCDDLTQDTVSPIMHKLACPECGKETSWYESPKEAEKEWEAKCETSTCQK